MSNYKVTVEEREIDGSIFWVCRHGIGDKAKDHFQIPISTGKPGNGGWTRDKYINKVKKDFPNWIITNSIIVPDVGERLTSTLEPKPSTVLHANHFDKHDEVLTPLETVDEDTGEVKDLGQDIDNIVKSFDDLKAEQDYLLLLENKYLAQDKLTFEEFVNIEHGDKPIEEYIRIAIEKHTVSTVKEKPEPVNSSKNKTMEKQSESTADAVKKVPTLLSRTVRVGASRVVQLALLPIHLGIVTAADVLMATDNLIARGEVAFLDKLGTLPEHCQMQDGTIVPMTRELARQGVLVQTRMIQNTIIVASVKPFGFVKDQFKALLTKPTVQKQAVA